MIALQDEMDLHLGLVKQEAETKIAFHPLLLPIWAVREIWREYKASVERERREREERDREYYKTLMQAELALEEIQPSEGAIRALELIGRAKGLLACLFLALLSLGLYPHDGDEYRSANRVRAYSRLEAAA